MSNSSLISPTAHYTGHVWVRNDLSDSAFGSCQGQLMYTALQPTMIASRLAGGPSLERYLLARHRAIDTLLEQAIDSGSVGQVVEIACGLSPRGWRFAARYGSALDYIETDLPAMAERKRAALERAGGAGAHHRVETLDALAAEGPHSLAALSQQLDRSRGTAVITEGLLSYLPIAAVTSLWSRIAEVLSGFPSGVYLSDIATGAAARGPAVAVGRRMLGVLVGGRTHVHFPEPEDAEAHAQSAGFSRATVRPAREILDADVGIAHVLEARCFHDVGEVP